MSGLERYRCLITRAVKLRKQKYSNCCKTELQERLQALEDIVYDIYESICMVDCYVQFQQDFISDCEYEIKRAPHDANFSEYKRDITQARRNCKKACTLIRDLKDCAEKTKNLQKKLKDKINIIAD